MAFATGWLSTTALIVAALIPLGYRLRMRRRAAPTSKPIRVHVIVGLIVLSLAFLHTLAAIPALGSPAATGGGNLAIVPAGAAFFLLVAHAGLGFQLRRDSLRDRVKKRRAHAATALAIALAVGVHVVLLEASR